MKRILSHLLEPRSIILGFSVFYFSCAFSLWIPGPLWYYHAEMFVAGVLLISAVGLAINRVSSNLLAAVVSGQLPFAFFAEFWMLSRNAELPIFSAQHIKAWFWVISSNGPTPVLWLTLSVVILSYSVVSILRHSPTIKAGADLWLDRVGDLPTH
jgi:hypothetical protein